MVLRVEWEGKVDWKAKGKRNDSDELECKQIYEIKEKDLTRIMLLCAWCGGKDDIFGKFNNSRVYYKSLTVKIQISELLKNLLQFFEFNGKSSWKLILILENQHDVTLRRFSLSFRVILAWKTLNFVYWQIFRNKEVKTDYL